MRPASPKMSSFSMLHLLPLLLTLHATQVLGLPLSTPGKCSATECDNLINEIQSILSKPPLPSQEPLNSNEIHILRKNNLLKLNLDAFLNAAKDFQDKGKKIGKNLERIKTVLPTFTSTEDPIHIKKGNWGDFWRKITKYLNHLENFIKIKICCPRSSSP